MFFKYHPNQNTRNTLVKKAFQFKNGIVHGSEPTAANLISIA